MPARTPLAALLAALVLVGPAAGCGGDPDPAPDPVHERQILEYRRADPDATRLVGGGTPELRRRLRAVRGRPVVVNQWASWCGPCRAEFPFLSRQAIERRGKVAFIGVNSGDATGDAKTFLAGHPTPYAHVEDPDYKVARGFRGGRVSPTTAYYDAQGRLNYTKQGGYATEQALVADIERYAR